MEEIKGTYRNEECFEYKVHIHEGEKGGIYIIYWNV